MSYLSISGDYLDGLAKKLIDPDFLLDHGEGDYFRTHFERDHYHDSLVRAVFSKELSFFTGFIKRRKHMFENESYQAFLNLLDLQLEILREKIRSEITEMIIEECGL